MYLSLEGDELGTEFAAFHERRGVHRTAIKTAATPSGVPAMPVVF
jgi:hypothetical protein